jgi:hypothetical protein
MHPEIHYPARILQSQPLDLCLSCCFLLVDQDRAYKLLVHRDICQILQNESGDTLLWRIGLQAVSDGKHNGGAVTNHISLQASMLLWTLSGIRQ